MSHPSSRIIVSLNNLKPLSIHASDGEIFHKPGYINDFGSLCQPLPRGGAGRLDEAHVELIEYLTDSHSCYPTCCHAAIECWDLPQNDNRDLECPSDTQGLDGQGNHNS